MSEICGRCAHHYEGAERQINTVVTEGKVKRSVVVVTTEHGGHTSHPNGKCTGPGSCFRGVVTGFYGYCDKWMQRGGQQAMPERHVQADIEDFAQL